MTAVNDLADDLAKVARELAEVLEKGGTGGLTPPALACDVCAQTIAYGMFLGRLHHTTMENLPKPIPLLQELFECITTDDRIRKTVNKLDDILQSADIELLLNNFGKTTKTDDAAIHFYENFLTAYNPDERKSHGVFYSPQPVVNYIVRAVDDILRQEFQYQDGIADSVPILDPATGTGTFLAELIKQIHSHVVAKNGQDAWHSYVANNLLQRLHGFEVLPAPYLIAHLKLAMLLEETGYRLEGNQSVNVRLQNALEMECNQSSTMVILGNPPYNVSTMNKGTLAKELIKNYKAGLGETKTNLDDDYIKFIALGQQLTEGGGIVAYVSNNSFLGGVTHRNMRRSLFQTFDKVYILNLHGDARKKETAADGSKDENVFNIMQGTSINIFVRTPSSKKERLGKVFYADLYGKRSEKFHFLETQSLDTTEFTEIAPTEPNYFFVPKDLSLQTEYEKGFSVATLFLTYNSGIKTDRDLLFFDDDKERLAKRIEKLLLGNFDESFRKEYRVEDSSSYKITARIQGKSFDRNFLRRVCYRPFDEKWIYYDPTIISRAGNRVMQHMVHENIALLTSRLIPANQAFNRVFVTTMLADGHAISDQTYVFPLYTYDSSGKRQVNLNAEIVDAITKRIGLRFVHFPPLEEVSAQMNRPAGAQDLAQGNALGYNAAATTAALQGQEKDVFLLPLSGRLDSREVRNPRAAASTPFTRLGLMPLQGGVEKCIETIASQGGEYTSTDIFDYIYGVLHDPVYRTKYREFLQIDFPRVPYPKDAATFDRYVRTGSHLRKLHLLEDVPKIRTTFPVSGDNTVENVRFVSGKVFINKTQYFGNVSEAVWEFPVGDYRPAQKYLKDRKGRTLTPEEIVHYQKITAILEGVYKTSLAF